LPLRGRSNSGATLWARKARASPERLDAARKIVRSLNPDANLIEAGDADAKPMQPRSVEKAEGPIPGLEACRTVMKGPLEYLHSEAAGTLSALGPGVETCDASEGLAAINQTDMELAIWRRVLPPCLATWLERIDASRLPDLRILVQPSHLRRAVEPYLDECGLPRGDMRNLLIGDVDDLVSAFSKITQTDLVDVRLERVSHNACWKFHRDCVEARLLTTYRGPATEWVQPRHARQALHEQKRYGGPIEHLRIHDVAVFKGSCAGPGSGIVHRSPPIARTGRTRLLLCLNKPSDASPEPWPQRACVDIRLERRARRSRG